MQLNRMDDILKKADRIVRKAGSRDPEMIAKYAGITIFEAPFQKLKGAYKVIERTRYIFIKEDLDDVMRSIVLLHEIGHDTLHRRQASQFHEFNLFDMSVNAMEFEANLFAAQIALPDEEVIEYIMQGFDASEIARAMHSDINLVALKVSDLSRRGYAFHTPEHRKNFLQ